MYSYLEDDGSGEEKWKCTKTCVIKRQLKLEDYKNCLGANRFENTASYLQNNKIDADSQYINIEIKTKI